MSKPMDWYRAMTPDEALAWWKTATPEQRRLVGRALRDACIAAAASINAFAASMKALGALERRKNG